MPFSVYNSGRASGRRPPAGCAHDRDKSECMNEQTRRHLSLGLGRPPLAGCLPREPYRARHSNGPCSRRGSGHSHPTGHRDDNAHPGATNGHTGPCSHRNAHPPQRHADDDAPAK